MSCGVCNVSCTARQLTPGYVYYVCQGKINLSHAHLHERYLSRFIPAKQLDELIWQDLCQLMTHPEIITSALQRAQGGGWLPQELQARRENLRRGQLAVQTQLDRLTEAYLNQIVPLPEYQRRRADLDSKLQGMHDLEKQLVHQVDRRNELSGLTGPIETFCRRVQAGLNNASFEQRRKLVELLVDRVIVKNENVEIRYVIPTSPAGEHVRFCHLRKDYFSAIIGTRDGWIGIESTEARPSLTQPDEQIPHLAKRIVTPVLGGYLGLLLLEHPASIQYGCDRTQMIGQKVLQPKAIIHRNGHPDEGIILDHFLGGSVIWDFIRSTREVIGFQNAAAGHSIHLLNVATVPIVDKLPHGVRLPMGSTISSYQRYPGHSIFCVVIL